MIRLKKEMAIIATVLQELKAKPEWDLDKTPIFLQEKNVLDYSDLLDTQSHYAVINDFSKTTLEQFFEENDFLFQRVSSNQNTDDESSPQYKLQVDSLQLAASGNDPDENYFRFITKCLFELLDPVVNYPSDLLSQMNIEAALSGNLSTESLQ